VVSTGFREQTNDPGFPQSPPPVPGVMIPERTPTVPQQSSFPNYPTPAAPASAPTSPQQGQLPSRTWPPPQARRRQQRIRNRASRSPQFKVWRGRDSRLFSKKRLVGEFKFFQPILQTCEFVHDILHRRRCLRVGKPVRIFGSHSSFTRTEKIRHI
jgi:hypothetical protein